MQTLMAVISETVVMVPQPSTAEKHSRGGNQEPWKTSKHPRQKGAEAEREEKEWKSE